MVDTKTFEVALSYVYEQRSLAKKLMDELYRLGISVFCDYFENTELIARRVAIQEVYEGFERADIIVLFFSKEYLDRAWGQDERELALSEISKPKTVLLLRFDDVSIPKGLPRGINFKDASDYEVKKLTEEISEKLFGHRRIEEINAGSSQSPQMTSLTGEVTLSPHDGYQFVIGRDELKFEMMWSRRNAGSIYVYNDPPSIEGVALAKGYTSIDQIIVARFLNYTAKAQEPSVDEIVVLRNTNGFYAAVHVLEVTDSNQGSDEQLRFRYVIQPDGSDDFSGGFQVESIRIQGFRSLKDVHLSDLGPLVAMIGPNGCGKSNVIRLFEMMWAMLGFRRLASFVGRYGGGDDQLFNGSKETPKIDVEVTLQIGQTDFYDYRFGLEYGNNDRLLMSRESYRLRKTKQQKVNWNHIESSMGSTEAGLIDIGHKPYPETINSRVANNISQVLGRIRVYQFHDTSIDSGFKKLCDFRDHNYLAADGRNLAAVLFRLEREDRRRYDAICRYIGRVLPEFDRFNLQVVQDKVALRWVSKNASKTFGAHLTSDGSLRLFALITLLNLPSDMLPTIVFLDEPELGLHPTGIALIGGMIKSLSSKKQILVATQSPILIDTFRLDEVIVLEADKNGSQTQTLNSDEYKDWLDEGFLPGELWQKNLFGGLP